MRVKRTGRLLDQKPNNGQQAQQLLSPRLRELLRSERYSQFARELGGSAQMIVVGSIRRRRVIQACTRDAQRARANILKPR